MRRALGEHFLRPSGFDEGNEVRVISNPGSNALDHRLTQRIKVKGKHDRDVIREGLGQRASFEDLLLRRELRGLENIAVGYVIIEHARRVFGRQHLISVELMERRGSRDEEPV